MVLTIEGMILMRATKTMRVKGGQSGILTQDIPSIHCKVLKLQFSCQAVRIYITTVRPVQ